MRSGCKNPNCKFCSVRAASQIMTGISGAIAMPRALKFVTAPKLCIYRIYVDDRTWARADVMKQNDTNLP